jgi:rSAM/selenodomain-associated transferase 1
MDAVVIMAKEPEVGKVKTRLVPPLTAETAAELYLNFLLDKIDQVKILENVQPYFAFYPESGEGFFQSIAPDNFKLIEQKGKDLGERLDNISTELIDMGYSKVVLMDSDTPNLSIQIVIDGLRTLNEFDVVLGPCEDGGYYLIGIKSKASELFQNIPWSTEEVTRGTIAKAEKMGLKITLLESWYDVDTIDEVKRLKKDIEEARITSPNNYIGENTYKFLSKILNQI